MDIISGIYEICNIINGHRYIGSSVNIKERWYRHKRALGKNKHHSRYLQRSWNIYGQHNFEFRIIEHCAKKSLLKREQFYIDTLKPEYNMSPIAGSSLGRKTSAETRAKQSMAATGKVHDYMYGSKNPFFGHRHTVESRSKISAASKNRKITPETHAKMSKSLMGNKNSLGNVVPDEVKKKISVSMHAFWERKKAEKV